MCLARDARSIYMSRALQRVVQLIYESDNKKSIQSISEQLAPLERQNKKL